MMGASKRIMEMFLLDRAKEIPVSTARFANVAFSNGSLLMGFQNRILKRQPLAAPKDIQRYFVTPEESGQLCLMSTILGRDGEIFFPKPNDEIKLTSFSEVARRFLESQGFEPIELEDEEKARKDINQFVTKGQWPCVFSNSDTTGEKPFEEFYTDGERIDLTRFSDIGIVENAHIREPSELSHFISRIEQMKSRGYWMKSEIVAEFQKLIPNFSHQELGKNLDQKM
jgi:FlaA1/EpsC-like NDP-sugar epimerase